LTTSLWRCVVVVVVVLLGRREADGGDVRLDDEEVGVLGANVELPEVEGNGGGGGGVGGVEADGLVVGFVVDVVGTSGGRNPDVSGLVVDEGGSSVGVLTEVRVREWVGQWGLDASDGVFTVVDAVLDLVLVVEVASDNVELTEEIVDGVSSGVVSRLGIEPSEENGVRLELRSDGNAGGESAWPDGSWWGSLGLGVDGCEAKRGEENESDMVPEKSSIGLISSRISARPLRAFGSSVQRLAHASLPTSQSKDSVWMARRLGTSRCSVIRPKEMRRGAYALDE